jgi:fatty acid desaturase
MTTAVSVRAAVQARRSTLVWALGFVLLNALVFFALPALGVWHPAWWFAGAALVLGTQGYWALIHEAMHGHLGATPRTSHRLGRVLCWFFPAPFRVLRTGHLLHHALNRSEFDRNEVYDPCVQSRGRAAFTYYPRLLIGLYLAEVAATVLVWLPRAWLQAGVVRTAGRYGTAGQALVPRLTQQCLSRAALRELRVDSAVILVLVGAAAWCHSAAPGWFFGMLLARGVIVSFSDNAFHYGTAVADRQAALNLATAAWYARWVCYFNLHGTHHRHPALPWWELPQAFAREGGRYDGRWARQALRQLRGPLPLTALSHAHPAPPAVA